MKLTQFQADCFKNLRHVSFQPHSSYNLILGENAQGKTNLLESIWCFTGCRSFRGTRERDYLPFDGGVLQVEAGFQDSRREQTMKMCMGGGATPEKKFWCNDILRKGSELFSIFHCVIFTPEILWYKGTQVSDNFRTYALRWTAISAPSRASCPSHTDSIGVT